LELHGIIKIWNFEAKSTLHLGFSGVRFGFP